MANVIEIIIHATDQATAQIKGAKAAAAEMSGSFSSLLSVVGGPAGVAAALGAAGLAAIEMTNRFSDEIEELHNLGTVTGLSINQLRTLRQVMIEAGKSPDALNSALVILKRKMEDNDGALRKIIGDTNDTNEALLRISRAGGTASQAFAAMGRGGAELAAILPTLADSIHDVHSRLGDLDGDSIRLAGNWDRLMDHMNTATKRFLDGSASLLLKALEVIATFDMGPAGLGLRAMGFGPESPTDKLKDKWAAYAAAYDKMFNSGGGVGGVVPGLPNPLSTGVVGIQPRGQHTGPLDTKTLGVLFDSWNKLDGEIKKTTARLDDFKQAIEDIRATAAADVGGFMVDAFVSLAFEGKNAAQIIRDSFIRALEDIAAKAVSIGLGRLLLGIAGGASGGFLGFLGAVGGSLLGGTSQRSLRGSNVTINAIDSKSVAQSLRDPTGGMRLGMNRLAIGTNW